MPAASDLTLKRVALNDDATFGVLLLGTIPFAVTLERPWLNNAPQKSCIPFGVYVCKRVKSPKFGDTFEVTGVPGRSHILFHQGNIPEDSLGCILVGERFDPVNGKNGITASREGFKEFLRHFIDRTEFTLTIE